MKRAAVRNQTKVASKLQQLDRFARADTESLRSGKPALRTRRCQPDVYRRAWSLQRELDDLCIRIEGEAGDAAVVSHSNIERRLYGVAEHDVVGRNVSVEQRPQLGRRGNLEARSLLRQRVEDLELRVRLHGVEDPEVGQSGLERGVGGAHLFEVDHQKRRWTIDEIYLHAPRGSCDVWEGDRLCLHGHIIRMSPRANLRCD